MASDPTLGSGESLKLRSLPTQNLHLPSAWHVLIVSRWPGHPGPAQPLTHSETRAESPWASIFLSAQWDVRQPGL